MIVKKSILLKNHGLSTKAERWNELTNRPYHGDAKRYEGHLDSFFYCKRNVVRFCIPTPFKWPFEIISKQ